MSQPIKWRWASVRPTIPVFVGVGVSPYAFLPLLIWLFWWSWTTFYVAMGALLLSIIMAVRGFTLTRLLSFLRHVLRGRTIQARPWWYLKRYAPRNPRIGDLRSDVTYPDLDDE